MAPAGAQTSGSGTAVSVTTLHFRVLVGPQGSQVCDIIGDLYRPSTASRAHPAPAILTTNGFGGSKDDQAYLGQAAASRGYAVLSYSGLGFGGSSCKIELDDPDWDGKAASQLIGFLGGAPGVGFTDAAHTHPFAAPDYVAHDKVAHDGKAYRFDPRVGMVGGSYGGEVQFAAAAIDPRLDAIVPLITWNDLSYSLEPNNVDFVRGVTSATAGVVKLDWPALFFAEGSAVDGTQGFQQDPSRVEGCPNFDNRVCASFAQGVGEGFPDAATQTLLRHASVESYMSRIRIPTLLMQGENDTLFNLQEAIANYQALQARGVPVSMVWQSWGHSDGTPAPGEFASNATVFNTYEGQRVLAWFDHYLKGLRVSTGPGFAYYRDWIPFHGSGPDSVQYATAPSFPGSGAQAVRLYLSGTNSLVSTPGAVQSGSASYANAPGGVPTSYSETSAVQGSFPNGQPGPSDAQGTFVAYASGALSHAVDIAGVPSAILHLSAPSAAATQGIGPAGMAELFAKIYDVAPDGTVTLVHRLVSAVRVGDVTAPVSIQLPGIVHRFAAGHRIELVIAATDAAFKNSYPVTPVSVVTSPSEPGVLTLPIVG